MVVSGGDSPICVSRVNALQPPSDVAASASATAAGTGRRAGRGATGFGA